MFLSGNMPFVFIQTIPTFDSLYWCFCFSKEILNKDMIDKGNSGMIAKTRKNKKKQ